MIKYQVIISQPFFFKINISNQIKYFSWLNTNTANIPRSDRVNACKVTLAYRNGCVYATCEMKLDTTKKHYTTRCTATQQLLPCCLAVRTTYRPVEAHTVVLHVRA